jgi:hypothetical protein
MVSELQPELRGPHLPGPERTDHPRRAWCVKLLPACVVIIALIGVGALVVTRHNARRDPIVEVGGGAVATTVCFPAAPAVTSGADHLTNQGRHPVTVVSASPLLTTNAQLVDTAVVALTGQGAIGQGVGLPTSTPQKAAAGAPQDWADRQFVPTAVIPPRSQNRDVRAWQLVFGLKILHPGQPGTLNRVRMTFRQGHRTWSLTSKIHIVVSGTAALPAHC